MNAKENRPAPSINEPCETMTFQFSESSQTIQSTYINEEPWFIANDVCYILGHTNPRKAISNLEKDEKADVTISYTSSNGVVQKRNVNCINESGLYALIFKSRKNEAKLFRKWITSEVLPSLRKKGYYAMSNKKRNDFIDARTIPYQEQKLNGFNVRFVNVHNENWFSINDIHKAIGSATCATQSAKKLNAVQTLAIKVLLFGNTNPAWFTNTLGFQLLLSGSRVLRDNRQLELSFLDEKEVSNGTHR